MTHDGKLPKRFLEQNPDMQAAAQRSQSAQK